MRIDQLSVFLENKPGMLCDMAGILAENEIDISSISLADTSGFGIVRLIVNDPQKAKDILGCAGIVGKITPVSALAMNDSPGSLSGILQLLADEKINVEYMYACVSPRSGQALMVMQTDDIAKTERVLDRNHLNSVSPADIYRI